MSIGTEEFQQIISLLRGLDQTKDSQKRHEELKTLIVQMHSLMIDSAMKAAVSREKFRELETMVDCLAQSSVSRDSFSQLETLVDSIAQTCSSDYNSSSAAHHFINNQIQKFCDQITQIYWHYDSTEYLCEEVAKFSVEIERSLTIESKKLLQKQIDLVNVMRNENSAHKQQISQQIDSFFNIISQFQTSLNFEQTT